jgi:signal peptidase I
MASSEAGEKKETIGELVRTVIYALLIALIFRIFFFQPFSIPSSSMKSTLLIGDYLFVSKYAYGYSRHSIPFSPPLFEGRIWSEEPTRGDVIVFKNRNDGNKDYIKRLIGLPGERIKLVDGAVYINGTLVPQRQIEDFIEPLEVIAGRSQVCLDRRVVEGQRVCVKEQFMETLPNGTEHLILNADPNDSRSDNTREFTVPEGHYFFLGDNRDNSGDSRVRKLGMVPFEDLIGRAEIIFLSSEGNPLTFWKWRMDRFLDAIR